MSPANTNTTAQGIVNDVLSPSMARAIWTGNYEKALPISVQAFELGAVLPAVFYMFRFSCRRGKGKFIETFGDEDQSTQKRRRDVTIDRIAGRLAARLDSFEGFETPVEKAILGDLLLCFCLENTKHAMGRTEQVQRVAPTHYLASWVDLPNEVAHLRYVPEMIVAMLADQQGDFVQGPSKDDNAWCAVGRGFDDNVLLQTFHQGVVQEGLLGDRTSDRFQEESNVGLDQLLMIRLAQQLGVPPDKLRGGGERIPNQRPIAERTSQLFSEDMRRFVKAYSGVMPRQLFVDLLESCMAIGLTTIIMSVIELLFAWAETGAVRKKCDQHPAALFVDCSNGIDHKLRGLAEQSLEEFFRRAERFPIVLMALRLLDHGARSDRQIKALNIPTTPYATEWLNLLGDLLHGRRSESSPFLYDLGKKTVQLAEALTEADYPDPEAAAILDNDKTLPNPVWRLAEAITLLLGRENMQGNLTRMIDSSLLINRPNGLAAKRGVDRKQGVGEGAKKREMRSLIFTDSALDYLVHCRVLPKGNSGSHRRLSFREFLKTLNERYGFCIDVAPPGMTISNDLLQRNRAVLERRLRDLGLLAGVNDAETMKYLQPRFEHSEGNHGTD
jgi:hypothetical protein